MLNRRDFFGWLTAATAWLVFGRKAQAKCNCGFLVCEECGPAVAPPKQRHKYKLVLCDKTRPDEPDKYLWLKDDA
jgi:methylthioribose-1-phosphate isomerase